MSTTLHSFIDLFDSVFGTEAEPVQLKKIVIPMIQRDYAQGRIIPEVNRVRKRFLRTLYNAVTGTPVTLDFIYGDINEEGIMTPLDGQQRLTTLFLLHWYASKKEKIDSDKTGFLHNFSYETRYSARYFCQELADFAPSFSMQISKDIINQAWFPLSWKKDPTISSMLVMLDEIDACFSNVSNIWERLENRAITFYFLPIKDMGLTDELYIKMNSRGKPLSTFEHFKAELERSIRSVDSKMADRISFKIDLKWTDLLWNYRGGRFTGIADNTIDDEFLRYFRFICDIICYQNGKSPQGMDVDEFDLLDIYFSPDNPAFADNIETFESFFDCWCDIPEYDTPSKFLDSFMSKQHEPEKITVDMVDIFSDCLHSYADKSGRTRSFPLNKIVLLYAITVYLRNMETVSAAAFARRIRVVNNLIQNSTDELSDRADRNRIPAILQQVDSIIIKGVIDESIENNFNVNQIKEENDKAVFIRNYPDKAELLFRLEDHPRLKGQISIIGLAHLDYTDRFESLFSCNWDKIDCALMSMGNYGQREKNKWRHQYGSKALQSAWDGLFHKSSNDGFERTSKYLIQLLDQNEIFTDDILQSIADEFTTKCESQHVFPWRYYYIKYDVFRPGKYGKFSNDNPYTEPYMYMVLQTQFQWSSNTYMPFLKAADNDHLIKSSAGMRLDYGNLHIVCRNSSFLLRKNEDSCVVIEKTIPQDEEGLDTVDRIILLKEFIKETNAIMAAGNET